MFRWIIDIIHKTLFQDAAFAIRNSRIDARRSKFVGRAENGPKASTRWLFFVRSAGGPDTFMDNSDVREKLPC
jgi:hypothetical protein